ncbi:50S ribosomal protein L1 [Raphidocelis subcapitata]|uniref:Ribosomal protein n=1 Tax=Raphidocelis subcapitata TaxID=307507 RepID=A0A2V0P3Y8_9CHLO|nr:50S ribosomal protein L1 [Raphidocelis subcapitata]|eukprot:GBF94568.1 50S ribosomal protein L1 [Raphidocelis subcapitata]
MLSRQLEAFLAQRGLQSSSSSGSEAESPEAAAGSSGGSGGETGASSSGDPAPATAASAEAPASTSGSGWPAPEGPWLDPSRPRLLPRLLGPPRKRRPLPLLEALEAVKEGARAKFDETVEAHVRLKVDPRRGDQMVRGATLLPHSAGRPVRVAVFAEGDAAEAARAAGADVVGGEELIASILESKGRSIDFTAAVAHPDMMRSLVRLGKLLGPKGLMPNPKLGTLTADVAGAVREVRRGRVEFKMDRTAIVHAPIGKVSMAPSQLYANMGALTAALLRAKPDVIKGGLPKYVAKVTVASTMGRGFEVEASSLLAAVDAAQDAAAAAASGA